MENYCIWWAEGAESKGPKEMSCTFLTLSRAMNGMIFNDMCAF